MFQGIDLQLTKTLWQIPKPTEEIMEEWVRRHNGDLYPDESGISQLVCLTHLSSYYIRVWFHQKRIQGLEQNITFPPTIIYYLEDWIRRNNNSLSPSTATTLALAEAVGRPALEVHFWFLQKKRDSRLYSQHR